VQLEVSDAIVV